MINPAVSRDTTPLGGCGHVISHDPPLPASPQYDGELKVQVVHQLLHALQFGSAGLSDVFDGRPQV